MAIRHETNACALGIAGREALYFAPVGIFTGPSNADCLCASDQCPMCD
jgi:hypothetical protein